MGKIKFLDPTPFLSNNIEDNVDSSPFNIAMRTCVYRARKCSFFEKFGVLCFLVTPVLRFALLPYCRRNLCIWNIETSLETSHVTGNIDAQPAFTCSKLTIEILEQGVKLFQS